MPLRLLLVEDDPSIQRMYDEAFSNAGFLVATANDGTIVLETIQLSQPDIVTMDVMMPNFNGLDALKDIKTNPSTQNIPVVMLSAYDDEKLVKQALSLGASRYLVKDKYDPQQVADILKDVIRETFGPESVTKADATPITPWHM